MAVLPSRVTLAFRSAPQSLMRVVDSGSGIAAVLAHLLVSGVGVIVGVAVAVGVQVGVGVAVGVAV